MALQPGQDLAHYRIVKKIGEGGMGEVWEATDTRLDRKVAIKTLPATFSEDGDRIERFNREARLLATLSHPHIAAIHGLEQQQGVRFLVMELVPGQDLSRRLEQGALPIEDALDAARQIADALEAAHETGIIHRDLKPANIQIATDGSVKVLDFGLAKALESEIDPGRASMSPTLTTPATMAGTIMGTAAYMSPEQAKGKPVDRRADIWSFGCVLYEMLTGTRPFQGDGVSETLASVIMAAPVMERLPEELPAPVRRILARCLEKDPRRRLRDIGEARFVLEETLAGKTDEVAAPGAGEAGPARRRVSAVVAAAATLGAALAATAVGYLVWSTPAPRHPVRFHTSPPPGVIMRSVGSTAAPVSVSPDGRHLVYGGLSEGGSDPLFIRTLDVLEARPLKGTEGAARPFWSPDSRTLGFFAGGKLRKIDIAGGPTLTLCDAPSGRGGTWNAENVILFAPEFESGLHRVPAAGGEPTPVTELDETEETHRYPWFLPDGRHFLYLARKPASGGEQFLTTVYAASLDGDERQVVLQGTSQAYFDDGYLLFVREGTIMAQPFDPGSRSAEGEAFPIAEDVQVDTRFARASFSAGGGVVAYQSGASRQEAVFQWMSLDGQPEGTVGGGAAQSGPRVSPDGRRIAFNHVDRETGNWDVWLHEVERGVRTRFTFDDAREGGAVWSPDGERIAFTSAASGDFDLYVKPTSGMSQESLLLDTEGDVFAQSWSPDGRQIVISTRDQTTGWDVYVLDLETGETSPLLATKFDERMPHLSADARWLAYTSDESGRSEIYVASYPSLNGKWQISSGGGAEPLWSPAGSALYYLSPPGTVMEAQIEVRGNTLIPGQVRPLFDVTFPQELGRKYDVSPDGERFLVNIVPDVEGTGQLTVMTDWLEAVRQ